jgi:hypothetical protein
MEWLSRKTLVARLRPAIIVGGAIIIICIVHIEPAPGLTKPTVTMGPFNSATPVSDEGEMDMADDPIYDQKFKPVSRMGNQNTGVVELRFGENPADPQSFSLTIEPSYVARETHQTLPININDALDYCSKNLETLRKIAWRAKQSGKTKEVLS